MNDFRYIRAGLLAILVTGCGGGSDSSSGSNAATLSGRVAVADTQFARVCLDSNANLHCDNAEPSSTADETGRFKLSMTNRGDLSGLQLLAEFDEMPAAPGTQASKTLPKNSPPVFTLAAPAVDGVVVSGLTTLLVSSMRLQPRQSLEDALRELKLSLRLAETVDVLGGFTISTEPKAAQIDAAATSALQNSAAFFAETTSGSAGYAMAVSAPIVLRTLTKYVDGATGALTASTTTINAETADALRPSQCAVQTPAVWNINTDQGFPITSKQSYVAARIDMDASADFPEPIALGAQVRGRGNTTWRFPKKSYRVKLAEKSPLLGMPASKDWALLANYSDKTMLRNAVAMCLGEILDMDYVPAYRFVELNLNGEYQGLYQLFEQIKADKKRVDIGAPASSDSDADAGFLVEIDEKSREAPWFLSQRGLQYTVKSDATAPQAENIRTVINRAEQSLFSDSFVDSDTGYVQYLDVGAMIDFYLVNELMRNNDAFFSSTYVHRKRGGKLVFGPLWDFDIAAGNIDFNDNDQTAGWWVRTRSAYVIRLLQDPAFDARLRVRWQTLSQRLPAVQTFIDQSAQTLDGAQRRNFQRWNTLNQYVWPNAVVTGSYQGEVDYLKRWLSQRADWMDTQLTVETAR